MVVVKKDVMKHACHFIHGETPEHVLVRLKRFIAETCECFSVIQHDSEPYRFIVRDLHDCETSAVIGEFLVVDQLGGIKNYSPMVFWEKYQVVGA